MNFFIIKRILYINLCLKIYLFIQKINYKSQFNGYMGWRSRNCHLDVALGALVPTQHALFIIRSGAIVQRCVTLSGHFVYENTLVCVKYKIRFFPRAFRTARCSDCERQTDEPQKVQVCLMRGENVKIESIHAM